MGEQSFFDWGANASQDSREEVAVHKPPDYHDRYREFLAASDEKPVIAKALAPLLLPGSILDVGAGTGHIPDLMRVAADAYTAVECQPQFVELLRDKGYQVIQDLFPCRLEKSYPNVLLCHCLSGNRTQCEILVSSAWMALTSPGRLIIVTFRDNMDDYNKLLHRIGHKARSSFDTRFNFIADMLDALGKMTSYTCVSYVYALDLPRLADTLSFMATNSNAGTLERRAEIRASIMAERAYIDERYRDDAGSYKFPITHSIFTVDRYGH
jgi:SAM-dependent methyltransferase